MSQNIPDLCHQYIGQPVQIHLQDGRVLPGVIHEVRPDGVIFGPLNGGVPHEVKGGHRGNIQPAIGKGQSKPQVQNVLFFFPFFIPFFSIFFVRPFFFW
ncbi:hypothetical protein [Melghirimyces algeriensis]|uniref:Uncharacterized protein n=1 Tax=Melghirimyces algeriensis TaxID=910412 RepID=A0A521AK63_9BACL|nr:hypothetical protein [Melghirimyces algeriensis]SMO35224.1 hypothetical protein SAMN06264849_101194 [Melghirimyces algeriensis]